MFDKITSFKVDHTKLDEGIYERDEKDVVKTFDIRFCKPNSGEYLSPEVSHTIEHYMATYFKNVMPDIIYYVGPMGCLTGFYILTKSYVTKSTITLGLLGLHAYINSEDNIPGCDEFSCGNYKLMDLQGARKAINEFYKVVLLKEELSLYKDLLENSNKDKPELLLFNESRGE